MPTLLLSPRNIPDFEPLTAAARAAGWSVRRLASWRIEQTFPGEVAVYGEPLFVAAVAQQLSLALLEPPFDWLSSLPEEYLRRRVSSATLGALDAAVYPAFVKPADDKCFPARVYQSLADCPTGEHLSPATPVIISEPVTWELEFRCFVSERRCVGLSIYERSGELAQAPDGSWPAESDEISEARTFIDLLLADGRISLPPAVVVDIGRIAG